MEEVKIHYIRKINKLRRKITGLVNKINNNKKIGDNIAKNYLFKFQQLDDIIELLDHKIIEINDIVYNIKNNRDSDNKKNDNNILTQKDINTLFPFFCYYYFNDINKNTYNDSQNISNFNNTVINMDDLYGKNAVQYMNLNDTD